MESTIAKMYRSDGDYGGVDRNIEMDIRPFQLAYRKWTVYYVSLALTDPMREKFAHQIKQLSDGGAGIIKAMDGVTWQCLARHGVRAVKNYI